MLCQRPQYSIFGPLICLRHGGAVVLVGDVGTCGMDRHDLSAGLQRGRCQYIEHRSPFGVTGCDVRQTGDKLLRPILQRVCAVAPDVENRPSKAVFHHQGPLFAATCAEILTVVSLWAAFTGEIPNKKLFYRFLTSHFLRTRYGFLPRGTKNAAPGININETCSVESGSGGKIWSILSSSS